MSVCEKPIINVQVKIELLDHYEHTLGVITSKVSNTNGSINVKYEQGVRRTCNITINNFDDSVLPDNENNDFFINRKFKIYTGIYDKDEDIIYWFSQGVFITSSYDYNNLSLTLSGLDKFAFFTNDLKHHVFQSIYKIPAGTKVGKVISDIITLDMGHGIPTDPILPIIDSDLYDMSLPYDIEKTANENIGEILKEVATVLNADIFYNCEGHLVLSKSIVDEYHKQSPIYEIKDEDNQFINLSLSGDYTKAINQITVMGTEVDGITHSYTAINNNPSSPLRVSLIGNMYGDVEEISMGYSEKRCQDYAEYLLKKNSIILVSASYKYTPLPHLDVNKIIRIICDSDTNKQSDFLISEITIPLQPAEYTLVISNIEVLPFNDSISSIPDSAIYTWTTISNNDGTYSLENCINNSGQTFIIAPRNVGSQMITKLGKGQINPNYYTQGLRGVTDLCIEDGITKIEDAALDNYYYKTIQLSSNWRGGNDIVSIRLPDTLTSIGSCAFRYSYIEELSLPKSLNRIGGYAFSYSSVKSIKIPNNCNVESGAFEYCVNLATVSIGNNCVIDDYAFANTSNLTSISFGENCRISGDDVFYNCTHLKTVELSDSTNIIDVKFECCYNLATICLPSSITSIISQMFYCCYSLTSVNIPDSVTYIGIAAFRNCTSLTSITLPDSVTSIGDGAFGGCKSLESITILNPDCEIYDDQLTINETATIYGYEGSTAQAYAEKYGYEFVVID